LLGPVPGSERWPWELRPTINRNLLVCLGSRQKENSPDTSWDLFRVPPLLRLLPSRIGQLHVRMIAVNFEGCSALQRVRCQLRSTRPQNQSVNLLFQLLEKVHP